VLDLKSADEKLNNEIGILHWNYFKRDYSIYLFFCKLLKINIKNTLTR
jgi:hypothetical protein